MFRALMSLIKFMWEGGEGRVGGGGCDGLVSHLGRGVTLLRPVSQSSW